MIFFYLGSQLTPPDPHRRVIFDQLQVMHQPVVQLAGDPGSFLLLHRDELAGKGRLIHPRLALYTKPPEKQAKKK